MSIIIRNDSFVWADGSRSEIFDPSMLNETVQIRDEDFVTLRNIMRLLQLRGGYLEIWYGKNGVIDCIDYCANMQTDTESKDYLVLHKEEVDGDLSLSGGIIGNTQIEDYPISSIADIIDSLIIVTTVSQTFTLAELLDALFGKLVPLVEKEIE